MKRETQSAAPQAETIEVTIKDTEGNVIDIGNWSLDLWKRADELAQRNGLSMDQLVSKLIESAYAAKFGDGERINVGISGKHADRIERLADILEMSVEEMTDSILEDYLDDIYDHGRVGEHEVCGRTWKDLQKVKRVALKADRHDAEKRPTNGGRVWVFPKNADGKIVPDYSLRRVAA